MGQSPLTAAKRRSRVYLHSDVGLPRELLPGGAKPHGGGGDQGGLIFKHLRDPGSSLFRFFPLLLLQTFAHRRNGFSGITGVLARSVELVLIPEAPGKTFGRSQLALALNEHSVDLPDGSGRQRGAVIRAEAIDCSLIFRGTV